MVGANSRLISTEVAPFGGIKQSGLGREGMAFDLASGAGTKQVGVGRPTNDLLSFLFAHHFFRKPEDHFSK